MTRRIIFQIHWFLGITAGLVLAWMGLTGASMSFREEILEALNPTLYAPGVPVGADLSPDAIVRRLEAQSPGYYVSRLDLEADRHRAHGVMLLPRAGTGWRLGLADRVTGDWRGAPRGAALFDAIADLHRWLTLPGGSNAIGRQLTGFSALALVFFALSGLYLRWPRRATDWRSWLVLDLRKTGRNLWRTLHMTVATWLLLLYLLSAMTGLCWCYDWYQRAFNFALTGAPAVVVGGRGKGVAVAPGRAIDPAWAAFLRETAGKYVSVRVTLPPPGEPVDAIDFDARTADARHLRQTDRFSYDPRSASLKMRNFYAERPLNTVITQSVFELHRGSFFGLPGRIAILLSSAAMPLFAVTGYLMYLSRRRRKREVAANEI